MIAQDSCICENTHLTKHCTTHCFFCSTQQNKKHAIWYDFAKYIKSQHRQPVQEKQQFLYLKYTTDSLHMEISNLNKNISVNSVLFSM